MFSINDTQESSEQIEIQVPNYSEVGHKHEISDVNGLQDIINDLQERISKLESSKAAQGLTSESSNDEQKAFSKINA